MKTTAALVLMAATAIAWQNPPNPQAPRRTTAMPSVTFMTVDPGHFHAGLVQKEMYPEVSKRVHVYAPFGSDLMAHLGRILAFNTRKANPTSWDLDLRTGPDFMERMLKEKPGNVVILSGRNREKIGRIKAAVEAGLHVLADKPWIIDPADLPKLESALKTADEKGIVAYDIMTERYEITSMLQKEFINDPATFGTMVKGTQQEPGVYMESIHYLLKLVAGLPNIRPAWFFDVSQQGEGLPDVGTHLVDLIQWMILPEQSLDYKQDVQVVAAKRWPTVMTRSEFQKVTGEADFPDYLRSSLNGDKLDYYCNTSVSYALRGTHVKLDVLWNYEAAPGSGDTHLAVFRGTRARVEIRQGKEQKYRPELYVVPNAAGERSTVLAAVKKKIQSLQDRFPGVAVEESGNDIWITIPDRFREGHEAHFAQVTSKFLGYLKNPKSIPAWERPNMAAKYYTTTKGLEMSRAK